MAQTHKKYKNTVHKNPFREDRPKSYRGILIAILSVLALTAVILAIVFLTSYCGTVHLVEKEPGVLSEVFSGRTYYMLDNCYYAVVDENKPYAECDGVTYYKIKHGEKGNYQYIDPEKAIACRDEHSEMVFIYATEDFYVPDYTDIAPDYALVNEIEVVEYPVGYLNEEQCTQVMTYFNDALGVEFDYTLLDLNGDTVRWIYFGDLEECPGVYYLLKYIESNSGERYLYTFDRTRCVHLGENFSDFLDYVED